MDISNFLFRSEKKNQFLESSGSKVYYFPIRNIKTYPCRKGENVHFTKRVSHQEQGIKRYLDMLQETKATEPTPMDPDLLMLDDNTLLSNFYFEILKKRKKKTPICKDNANFYKI